MADRKISDLTSLTAPATGDLLPIVDISEAAAADKNKKITYGELLASAPAGTAAAPSFSFDGDPNTGIFNPTADTLAFAEGGVEAARIDSSGNVGIGVSSVALTGYSNIVRNKAAGGAAGYFSENTTADAWLGTYSGAGGGDFAAIVYPSTGYLRFATSTSVGIAGFSEKARIDSNGRLLVGTSTANTSGAKLQTSDGLTFPATQVASADPNTLDDYEEGTWTPTVAGTSTAGTATYTTQFGNYTKIGRSVTVNCSIIYTGGTGTGNLSVSGLPFTSVNTNNLYPIGSCSFGDISTPALSQAIAVNFFNSSYIAFQAFPLGGGAAANVSYDAAGSIYCTITYNT